MEGQHQQQHDPGSASRGGSSVRDKGKGRMRNIQQSEITPDVALLREIDAKKQQIVQGFPLASMTGVSDGKESCSSAIPDGMTDTLYL